MAGSALAKLARAGILTASWFDTKPQAEELNRGFIKRMQRGAHG